MLRANKMKPAGGAFATCRLKSVLGLVPSKPKIKRWAARRFRLPEWSALPSPDVSSFGILRQLDEHTTCRLWMNEYNTGSVRAGLRCFR